MIAHFTTSSSCGSRFLLFPLLPYIILSWTAYFISCPAALPLLQLVTVSSDMHHFALQCCNAPITITLIRILISLHYCVTLPRHINIVITSSHHHIITSSHHHIITSSHHHIITLSHHHIITSSHHHIITSSHHDHYCCYIIIAEPTPQPNPALWSLLKPSSSSPPSPPSQEL